MGRKIFALPRARFWRASLSRGHQDAARLFDSARSSRDRHDLAGAAAREPARHLARGAPAFHVVVAPPHRLHGLRRRPVLGFNSVTDFSSLSSTDLADRIAILRDNIRQLTEQAAGSLGAASEERTAERLAVQSE